MALLVGIVSQRIYPVPWDYRRLGLAIGTTTGLALASLAVDAWMPFAVSLPVRVGLLAAYPAALVLGGFFPPSDRAAIRSRFRKLNRLR
jgi:hypothetical protein